LKPSAKKDDTKSESRTTLLLKNDDTSVNSFGEEKKSQVASMNLSASPIYTPNIRDSWELTWPIWHMLPPSERKQIAKEYGFHNIGDFEESLTFSRALLVNMEKLDPFDNSQLHDLENRPETYDLPIVTERHEEKEQEKIQNSSNGEDSQCSEDLDHKFSRINDEKKVQCAHQDVLNSDDAEILIPSDGLIIQQIFPSLSIHRYATFALVLSRWTDNTTNLSVP